MVATTKNLSLLYLLISKPNSYFFYCGLVSHGKYKRTEARMNGLSNV